MGRQFRARFPWLEWVLLPVSYMLLLFGLALVIRTALSSSAPAGDYLTGVAALVAGLFGLALCDLLGQVQELHARLARLEFNQSGNLPGQGGETAPSERA